MTDNANRPSVLDYVMEYEFRGDQDYTPNEHEQTIIEDAIEGYLASTVAPPLPDREEIARIVADKTSCGAKWGSWTVDEKQVFLQTADAILAVPCKPSDGPDHATMRECLEWLDRQGGLGYQAHAQIRLALSTPTKGSDAILALREPGEGLSATTACCDSSKASRHRNGDPEPVVAEAPPRAGAEAAPATYATSTRATATPVANECDGCSKQHIPGCWGGTMADLSRCVNAPTSPPAQAAGNRDALVEALRPFANYADDARAKAPADLVITVGSSIAKRQLTMGDCYKARAALSDAGVGPATGAPKE